MAKAPASPAAWLDALTPDQRKVAEGLRALALAAAPGVTEHIKWNAPSFCHHGDDRITLGLDRTGRVRVVLHRGVKPKDGPFAFDDPSGRVEWAAPDRGIVTFADPADFDACRDGIANLFAAWLIATS